MVSVFLSHSSADKDFVRELADFLSREGGIKVWLDERSIGFGDNIPKSISEGLAASDYVLLVLSPDSVGSKWVQEEWWDTYWEQTNSGKKKLLPVLLRDCREVPLLRNKRRIDLRKNRPEGMRQILGFLLHEQPSQPSHYNQLPARPDGFLGRAAELAELRTRLQKAKVVYLSDMSGAGKTWLALEFAHRYESEFDAVYWLQCQGGLASIAGELERQLGQKIDGDLPTLLRELRALLAKKRHLLVLDNVQDDAVSDLIPGGGASVLITTRFTSLPFLRSASALRVPRFSDDECLDAFRSHLGNVEVERHKAECLEFCGKVGRLPKAVSVAAALVREDVRHSLKDLAQTMPTEVSKLMEEAVAAAPNQARALLAAMSACAAEGFRLDFPAEVAQLDEAASLDALQELVSRHLVEEIDRYKRRYQLHTLIREAGGGKALERRHADVTAARFEKWDANWRQCEEDLPEFWTAFDRALTQRWNGFDCPRLAVSAFALTKRLGRLTEANEIAERSRRFAEHTKDRWEQAWLGNQALILHDWGMLDEAMTLHKKEEAICLELDDRASLQASYGNQALILRDWGKLDEAMTLLRKQEAICLELGKKGSLQFSYGNQALILRAQGQFGKAMALHKKEEAICLELGDNASLQRSYGNQALILQNWGQLDEAMALLKKKEAICLGLGDKFSLANCYWNWGHLVNRWKDRGEARMKLEHALAIFTELGMPRDRDKVQRSLDELGS